MPSFTHHISSTPGNPVSYSPSMAETFSWIPVTDAGRPLYAQAAYITNASEFGGGGGGGGSVTVNTTILEGKVDGTNNRLDITNTRLNSLTGISNITNSKLDTLIDKSDSQLGLKGFDVLEAGPSHTGNWSTLTVVSSAAKFLSLSATNSTTSPITGYEIPMTFTMSGPFVGMRLAYGAVIAYKR